MCALCVATILYENSLKNKDNTGDTKQLAFLDLASCHRESKSLVLHKYFKSRQAGPRQASPHQRLSSSVCVEAHAQPAHLCPVFSRSGSFLTSAWWFTLTLARRPPSIPSEPV